MTKSFFTLFVLTLSILFFISLASADFLVCFDKGERINYCNPSVPDRNCNSDTGCTYCMSSYNEENNCFNQGNINVCNSGPQTCTEYNNGLNQTGNSTNDINGSISPNPPDVGVSLMGPNEGYSVPGPSEVTFTYRILGPVDSPRRCELLINNVNVSKKTSSLAKNVNLTFKYTLSAGSYGWGVVCYDRYSKSWPTTERTLTITSNSTTPPNVTIPQTSNVTLVSPSNDFSTTDTNVVFTYNASINLTSCNLIVNNNVTANSTNITLGSNTFSVSLSPASYTWGISCIDKKSKNVNSANFTLTINSQPPQDNSGGGGGGGGSSGGSSGGGGSVIVRTSTNRTNSTSQNNTLALNTTQSSSENTTDVPLDTSSETQSQGTLSAITGAVVGTLKSGRFWIVGAFILVIVGLMIIVKFKKPSPPHLR